MTKEQIVTELEKIASTPGFIYTLAILLRTDLFLVPSEAANVNWRDKLSIQEFTLLIGLMVKHDLDLSMPAPDAVENQIETIRKLFQQLHEAHMAPMLEELKLAAETGPLSDKEVEADYRGAFGAGEAIAEPIFYGGSGAYDFQFIAFAARRYHRDEAWLREHMGFTVVEIQEIPRWLKKRAEQLGNRRIMPQSFEEACEATLDIFTFTEADLFFFGDALAGRFLGAFSLVAGGVNSSLRTVGQFNEVTARPVVRLPDGRYFLPIVFLLFQSIYESPFYWMIRDKNYKETAAKNRGDTTEEIALDLLRPIFRDQVWKNVRVQRTKKLTTTDIDTLAVVGNKAVVLQEKSKKLTELARQGDTDALKRDFASAVQSAYEQGIASRQAILSRDASLFDAEGKEIHLTESLNEVYLVCLTADEYPAIVNQIDVFLERKDDQPFPIGMSLFDLDIVTSYLGDPFEFLYYVRQRVSLTSYYRASCEMAYLGFHLRHKLFPEKDADMVMIAEEFAQLVDANFPALRGEQIKTEAANKLHHTWQNAKFTQLMNEVKATGEPGLTDALFHLYDIAGDGADELIRTLEKTAGQTLKDGLTHDFSAMFGGGKIGISFLSHSGPPGDLGPRVMSHGMAKKYKTKAQAWLALGSQMGSGRLVDAIAFSDKPWEYDRNLEELASHLRPQAVIGRGGKKIGRNERCPCSSGKKYKKCCGSPI